MQRPEDPKSESGESKQLFFPCHLDFCKVVDSLFLTIFVFLILDIKYPFLKHTSHMLGSIPAPFASQFTSKDAAIHLNSAPQASSSVRVTAGMLVIRNIALNGYEVNNMYGKNSDLNIIYLYGIVEGNINSSQLLPNAAGVNSSKSEPLISRYFLYFFILFWVLILSASFKVARCIHSR